jgi:hypothetical protein
MQYIQRIGNNLNNFFDILINIKYLSYDHISKSGNNRPFIKYFSIDFQI